MIPRDESGDFEAQLRSLAEEFSLHLRHHAAYDERERQRDETLDRIEKNMDTLMERLTEWQGMGKLAKAVFWGIGPIVGAIVWLKEHFKW